MKIGIFGGSFDPFHVGHMAIITKALEQLKLDKIFVVPTTVNYYRQDKRYLFTYDEKCVIIRHFLCGFPGNVEIDTIEKDKDGNWRTIDLVQYFKKKFPNDTLYLIIGEDSFKEFKTWTRWNEILDYVQLAVANRSDHVGKTLKMNDNLKQGFDSYRKDSGPDANNASTPIIEAIPIDMGTDYEECSATNTRNKLISELMDMYLEDSEWYGKEE